MYEVCLIRIKEQVGEKRNTVYTHRYADCPPKITNMLSIKQLEHVDDISFRELFSRIRVVVLQNKTCLFLAQGICIYVDTKREIGLRNPKSRYYNKVVSI